MEDFISDHPILFVAMIFVVLVACAAFGTFASCRAATRDIGFNSRFDIMAGCQIEVNPGQWIPLESYYFKDE
jgi:hypothetical protein